MDSASFSLCGPAGIRRQEVRLLLYVFVGRKFSQTFSLCLWQQCVCTKKWPHLFAFIIGYIACPPEHYIQLPLWRYSHLKSDIFQLYHLGLQLVFLFLLCTFYKVVLQVLVSDPPEMKKDCQSQDEGSTK